jgi:oligopeptidase B
MKNVIISDPSFVVARPKEEVTLPAPQPTNGGRIVSEHGQERFAGYPWLTDVNRGARLCKHVQKENNYTSQCFSRMGIDDITNAVENEMLSRLMDYDSPPIIDGDWIYYLKYSTKTAGPSHWRYSRNGDKNQSQLLFDEDAETKEAGGQLALADIEVSDDGTLLLVPFDTTGEEKYQFEVRRITDGKVLCHEDEISADAYGELRPLFNSKGNGIFFVRHDEQLRDASLSYREFDPINGGWTTEEQIIYFEKDETFSVSTSISKDKKWIIVNSGSSVTSEIWLLDRQNPDGVLLPFAGRGKDLLYRFDIMGDYSFVSGNLETDASGHHVVPDGEFALYLAALDFENARSGGLLAPFDTWMESLELPSSVILESFDLFESFTAVETRVGGIQRVFVALRNSDGTHGELIPVGNPATMTAQTLFENTNPQAQEIALAHNGMHGEEIFLAHLDMNAETKNIVQDYVRIYAEPIPGLNPDDYVGNLIYADAEDGTKIPLAIFTPKSGKVIGTMLTVYGAYGLSDEPAYASDWQSILDHGVAIAVAYVRGGGELGRAWYNAGKFGKKIATMTDTLACARAIAKAELAGSNGKKIVLQGRSAGGAAVGGTINLDPSAFAGVIGGVPFVDCLATMLNPKLPLTIGEYEEWGNPTDSASAWQELRSWAPIENLKANVVYPPVLATGGLTDPRCGIWEPARWVLSLRDLGNEAYLRVLDAGHSGASNQFTNIKENAELAAFAIWCLTRD